MGTNDIGWRGTIQRNLTSLAESTLVTSEMAALLLHYNLISRSEEHNLMNSTLSDHDRAMMLYGKISRKWNDEGFDNFTKTLAECLNAGALDILEKVKIHRNPSVDIKNKPCLPADDVFKQNLVQLHAQIAETRRMNIQLRSDLNFLTKNLRAEFTAMVKNVEQSVCSNVLLRAKNVMQGSLAELTADIVQLKQQVKVQDQQLEDLRELADQEKHFRGTDRWKSTLCLSQQTSQMSDKEILPTQRNLGHLKNKEEPVEVKTNRNRVNSEISTSQEQTGKAEQKSQTSSQKKTFFYVPSFPPPHPSRMVEQDGLLSSSAYLKNLSVANKPINSPLTTKHVTWKLDDKVLFDVAKAMGIWYVIEGFFKKRPYFSSHVSSEFHYKMNGNLIQELSSGRIFELEIANPSTSPYFWRNPHGFRGKLWLNTDYENWAVLRQKYDGTCTKEPFQQCALFIVSRRPELPVAILERLRDVAVQHGYPREYGVLTPKNQ